MIKEAIILAGGLGTRLRETVPDLPKCMAPVAGRPFLFYVINFLRLEGVEKIVFSLGYKHEIIEAYLESEFDTLDYQVVIEEEPLGTGGAIKLALTRVMSKDVLVVNGDSIFRTNLTAATAMHYDRNAECTLLLSEMHDFDRYGIVETDDEERITGFHEKSSRSIGTINTGIYILNNSNFRSEKLPAKFSFEKDYLEAMYKERRFYGKIESGYFIDIGIPADFEKANLDFQNPKLDLGEVDRNWTLFIDRDGVINQEKKDDYILNWREFIFYEGVKASFPLLKNKFGHLIVVSNQRGVGKMLMTDQDLEGVHRHMEKQLALGDKGITRIYVCTSTDNKHPCRKPNPGMALQAVHDIQGIDLKRSIIIGNKLSDMRFGRNAGMFTAFIASTNPDTPFPHPDIDLRFNSLAEFAKAL